MAKLPYELLLVEWVDASRIDPNWIDIADIEEPYAHRCISVGYLVRENEEGIILAPNFGSVDIGESRHCYGGVMIPRHAIKTRKRLTAK
jgi:hypothetical protein